MGIPDDDDEDDEEENEVAEVPTDPGVQSSSEQEKERDDSEIRATAEQVVQEVITKASETAAEKLENGLAGLSFPVRFSVYYYYFFTACFFITFYIVLPMLIK